MKEYITPETLAAECREYEKIKAFNPHIIVNGKLEEPYYSIDYYDITEKEWHNGFGSSCLAYVQVWLRECFEEVDCAFMEVRHGLRIGIDSSFWKPTHRGDIPVFRKTYRCSECIRRTAIAENYCPNCGGYMMGENNGKCE